MVKVNLGGCSSFVKDADYKSYVEKALSALDVLEAGTGAGNDFLGWNIFLRRHRNLLWKSASR